MKHVKTSAGFEADIDEGIFDDLEMIEAIAAMEQGKQTAVPAVAGKILGRQKQAFYDFMRDEHGRVPLEQSMAQLYEMVQQVSGKNS